MQVKNLHPRPASGRRFSGVAAGFQPAEKNYAGCKPAPTFNLRKRTMQVKNLHPRSAPAEKSRAR
jgi:hypothetical protein